MCSHMKGLEVIAQIVDKKHKKKTDLYNCPVCKASFVKESVNKYRKVTPRYAAELF